MEIGSSFPQRSANLYITWPSLLAGCSGLFYLPLWCVEWSLFVKERRYFYILTFLCNLVFLSPHFSNTNMSEGRLRAASYFSFWVTVVREHAREGRAWQGLLLLSLFKNFNFFAPRACCEGKKDDRSRYRTKECNRNFMTYHIHYFLNVKRTLLAIYSANLRN